MTNAVEVGKVVHTTPHYDVVIGTSIYEESKLFCYQVINREYSVIEAETTVLPTAMLHANNFEDGLREMSPIDTPSRVALPH